MYQNKFDIFLNRDLTNVERLEPERALVRFSIRYLEQLERTLNNVSPLLTEEQLKTVADAVKYAHNAVSNATFLGNSDYHALPVESVHWQF